MSESLKVFNLSLVTIGLLVTKYEETTLFVGFDAITLVATEPEG